jgi:hypothetical protein
MADQLSLRGGTTAEHATFTGANKEVTVDTTKKTLVVNDGATVGGHPLMRENASNSALALGSAGTPSLKFTGDTNTGIYSPGADQLAVATNGTQRLLINASGNIGVGTASPGYVVHANRATAVNTFYASQNSLAFSLFGTDSAGSSIVYNNSAYPILFYTSGSERARITSAGFVGIGNSAPAERLHISGNMRLTGSTGATQTIFAEINANNLSTTNNPGVKIVATTGATTSIHELAFYTTANNAANTTEKVRITGAGNVGIGTSAPTGTLHVNGSALNTPLLKLAYTGNSNNTGNILIPIEVAQNTTAGGAVTATTLKITDTSTGGAFPSTKTLTGLHVDVSASTYGIKNAAIFAGGNVGIGDTAPNTKLEIREDSAGSVVELVKLNNNAVIGSGKGVRLGFGLSDAPTASSRAYIEAVLDGSNKTYLAFANNNGSGIFERARLDGDGRLLIGTSSELAGGSSTTLLQVAASSGGRLAISRSGATTNAGDTIGEIAFFDNESGNDKCAAILCAGDLDHASGDKPSRLVFSVTAAGAASPTERMRLNSSGRLLVGTSTAVAGADIQAATSLSIGGLVKREFSKELSLADAVATTYLTIAVPSSSFFTSRTNIGGEISYVIESSRQTSSRANKSVYGKVYFSISRFWESDANNPIFANLVSTDQSLSIAGSGADPTITWAASTDAGTDNATKNVYITITVNNPHAGTTGTSITGTVTYHTRLASVGDVTVS